AQDSVNEGGTQKIKATKDLPALTGRLSADAAFQVSMNTVGSSPVAVTVAKGLTQANRYLFDIVNDVQDAIDAVAALHGKIKVGFLANRLTFTALDGATTFAITATAGTPAVTELGLAASNTGNSYEFFISLREGGDPHGITLDGVTDLNGVLSAIHSQTSNKVLAVIDGNGTGIKLTDTTTGSGTFKVESANGTMAAAGLGILRPDAQEGESPDGVIEGAVIAGLSPLDRFFITNAGASVGLHLSTPEPDTDHD